MLETNHVSVLINPKAGGGINKRKIELLRKAFVQQNYMPHIHLAYDLEEDARFLADELSNGSKEFVVMGGDGTVNNAASLLSGKDANLGIIPAGSGNGLARHLQIPMLFQKALGLIKSHKVKTIDYGLINFQPFFCTAGLGFDATIARSFAEQGTRGLATYLKVILKEFTNYKSEKYLLKFSGQYVEVEAFLLTLANAGQFGSHALISPDASINDGFLNLCLISEFPKILAPVVGTQLISGKLNDSSFYETIRVKEIVIQRKAPGWVHLDGEPHQMPDRLHVKVVPSNLRVWVPDNFKE